MAEVAQAAPAPSVHERLKAVLSAPVEAPAASAPPGGESVAPQMRSETPSAATTKPVAAEDVDEKVVPKAQAEDQPAEGDESDDAQSDDWQPSTLEELAEGLGWDVDKLYGLPTSIKIDGKDSTAALRDLKKSYQLDGHLHQKLAALDTDRKALLADREKFNGERAEKLLQVDAGVKTLERLMMGEFQAIDWQKLAAEDPAAYNANLVSFQQRNAQLQDVARQIAQEQQTFQGQQAEAHKAWLEEQRNLLQSKIPEWSDDTRRSKDKAEILAYLNTVGMTKEEFEGIQDHRHALVIRDAWQWSKLQKSKPAVLNKVKAAPKLMKPGTQQSKAASDQTATNIDRARLKQTGKLKDAAPLLKRILFN